MCKEPAGALCFLFQSEDIHLYSLAEMICYGSWKYTQYTYNVPGVLYWAMAWLGFCPEVIILYTYGTRATNNATVHRFSWQYSTLYHMLLKILKLAYFPLLPPNFKQ